MDLAFESPPVAGPAEQLMLLLHGEGAVGAQMAPLAEAFAATFPQAALVAPDAPHAAAAGGQGRRWLAPERTSGAEDTDDAAAQRALAATLDALHAWVQATQRRLGVGPQATALVGFGQGATLALELVQRHDGLAGRVLAFGGGYRLLPAHAPRLTTLHLFHGADDAVVIGVETVRRTLAHLGVLHGDATLDIAAGVGHALHPALLDSALHRLTHHIPHRTWQAALGAAPGLHAPRSTTDPEDPEP